MGIFSSRVVKFHAALLFSLKGFITQDKGFGWQERKLLNSKIRNSVLIKEPRSATGIRPIFPQKVPISTIEALSRRNERLVADWFKCSWISREFIISPTDGVRFCECKQVHAFSFVELFLMSRVCSLFDPQQQEEYQLINPFYIASLRLSLCHQIERFKPELGTKETLLHELDGYLDELLGYGDINERLWFYLGRYQIDWGRYCVPGKKGGSYSRHLHKQVYRLMTYISIVDSLFRFKKRDAKLFKFVY